MHALAVFAILILLLASVVSVLHHLVKTISSSSGEIELYLVIDGYVFSIHNNETIVENLGYFPYDEFMATAPIRQRPPQGMRIKDPKLLKFLSPNAFSGGFVTRFEIFKLRQHSASLLEDLQYIGSFFNPSVIKWKGRLFATSRAVYDNHTRRHEYENHIEFSWLNHSWAPFYCASKYVFPAAA